MNRKEQTEKFAINGLTFCGILLIVLALFSFLTSCTKEDDITIPDNYTMELDGRLDTTNEGLYKLELNSSDNYIQTIHTIGGTL